MERTEWLKKVRAQTESLYDHLSPAFWERFGTYDNTTHREFIEKFLSRFNPNSYILDAACGAGRYDGMLIEAGHRVLGIDQSSGMLAKARAHFPQDEFPSLQYKQLSLQELDYQSSFDGVICIDAFEHIFPEDWPGSFSHIRQSLKPGGIFYFTNEQMDQAEVQEAFDLARAQGLPVVYGEVADKIDAAYQQLTQLDWQEVPGELAGEAAYHFYPPRKQLIEWLNQAGLAIEDEGSGMSYAHILAVKRS